MLHILKSSIFDSPAHALVNTVNTVGVMGKGIAKTFKSRYPAMYREYKQLCDKHALKIGNIHCWQGPSRWILNFPTKTTWKLPSKIEYIEAGLDAFVSNYRSAGIQSVSFPPLGCGNGQLDWTEVRPLMLKHLWNIDIPVFIHEWFDQSKMPEQYDPAAKAAPVSYAEFLGDLHAIIDDQKGSFRTLRKRTPFQAALDQESNLEIYLEHKLQVHEEFISNAWAGLQVGLLTASTLGSELDRYARYLMPIISALPYVHTVEVQLNANNPKSKTIGLFLVEGVEEASVKLLAAEPGIVQCQLH